jgi:hypothetical protein
MKLHPNAIKFFQDLADNHGCYPDTAEEVVYAFIGEWEMRDGTPKEFWTEIPKK